MAKKPKTTNTFAEFLFWFHTLVVCLITVSGIFVSWQWVLLILVLMKAQQYIFHGCFITYLELKEGGIPRGHTYYQIAAKRFFNARLGRKGVRIASFSQITLTIGIAVVAALYNFEVQL